MLFLTRTQMTLNLELSRLGMFSHYMQSAAATNYNVMLVNMPRQMESGIITKHSFGCKNSIIEHHSKMCSGIVCLDLVYST